MVFSNLIFLYLFLPVCLIAYFFCPGIRAKNAVLILFSLIFYAWGEPVYLLLMIASAAVNWYFGLLIERRRKKIFLILALVLDLGCLAVFKYAGFFVENLNAVFGASIPVPQIALPIGISFYTFQALSYTVDVWRGDVPAQRSFAKLLLYISLFPQLIAGPIVRYSDVAAQIDDRQFDASEDVSTARRASASALPKRCLLADAAGKVASQILDGSLASNDNSRPRGSASCFIRLKSILISPAIPTWLSAWGVSSASNIWRTSACRIPRCPSPISGGAGTFRSRSFFRDYVYIPLGGKKKHRLLNMAIVWALTGMWHGASWNFVLWGLYFFVILAIEKQVGEKSMRRVPYLLRRLGTMLLIIFGWNIFYYTDMTRLVQNFGVMFGLYGAGFSNAQAGIQLTNNLPLLLLCAIGATSIPRNLGSLFGGVCAQGGKKSGQIVYAAVSFVFDAALLALSTIALVGSTYNAFLYFRF